METAAVGAQTGRPDVAGAGEGFASRLGLTGRLLGRRKLPGRQGHRAVAGRLLAYLSSAVGPSVSSGSAGAEGQTGRPRVCRPTPTTWRNLRPKTGDGRRG